MTTTPKYYVKGNLSEKQIEADVASFMGWCTPPGANSAFRLLDIDEQKTGADKLFDRGIAIYMQFKKSTGLQSASAAAPSRRKGRSVLEDIREFRARMNLQDDPTLFFQLRAKAKTAADLQHNVLLAYERPPSSRAIYVAPLILDKTQYHTSLHDTSTRFLLYPFYYIFRYEVLEAHQRQVMTRMLEAVPFLREHISIPPHERVDDHNHYYAYSEVGTDISWHSPEVVMREPSRLSDFVAGLFRRAIANPEEMMPIKALSRQLGELSLTLGLPPIDAQEREEPMRFIRRHGEWLRSEYGIRQLLLLGRSDRISELRGEHE